MNISVAAPDCAEEILAVQKRAFAIEAERYNNFSIRPVVETIEEYHQFFTAHTVLILQNDNRIIGSVSIRKDQGTVYLNRLVVLPEFHGQGIAGKLIDAAVTYFPECSRVELFTGAKSLHNQAIYRHKGFIEFRRAEMDGIEMVFMEKILH